jgi:hypothetical protein
MGFASAAGSKRVESGFERFSALDENGIEIL